MVDAMVSAVLEQLLSTALGEAKERVRLITGVEKEVKRLQDNFEAIQAVLADAEQKQVKEAPVRLWLEKLKHASYDIEDVLDEWNTARLKLQIEGVDENAFVPQQKVCSSFFPAASCFGCKERYGFKQIFLRHDIAKKIKEINETLDYIARQKDLFNLSVVRSNDQKSERMQSTALINASAVSGRDAEKNTLKSKLLCESSNQQNTVQIISLVGMGGIGKTTLAQLVYNDKDVKNNFDIKMWVCVSDPFDEFRIAKAIIETLVLEGFAINLGELDIATNLGELNSLLLRIDKSITGKKFFHVLDDVWTEDYNKWESFQRCLINGQHGSKILVTTRKDSVARMMESTDVMSIKELSKQDCWLLFERLALFDRPQSECEQLEEIGRKIVDKCKGLPLAAKTIGSLLRFKKTLREWQNILNSEMWQLEEFEKGLLAPLLLSYNDLPSAIKRCFSYCAVFPKDYNIEKDELIKLWLAQGYIRPKENEELAMIGEEYFDYLATRSFFQEFKRLKGEDRVVVRCKMHDIVHDFAQYLTKNECFSIELNCPEEPLLLINTSNEKLRHLMLVLDSNCKAPFPGSILNAKKLRSLLISEHYEVILSFLPGLFDQLTYLRTLKITGGDIWYDEIPKEIGKLIHLRFLKLVRLNIQEFPETCCELFNLQTLQIEKCKRFKRLPLGFGKLVNLRQINEFIVSNTEGKDGRRSSGCKLEGLRQLNHLQGSLKIRGLRNVKDFDEAKIAELEQKKNLLHLELSYKVQEEEEETEEEETEEEEDEETQEEEEEQQQQQVTEQEEEEEEEEEMEEEEDRVEEEEEEEENEVEHEAIIEALRPPPNLESLRIEDYIGKTLPSWIVSFNKMKKLRLENCRECEIMPPLGMLPSLEILQIWSMKSMKKVGDEFLRIKSSDRHDIHIQATSSSLIAFPKLKLLEFYDFYKWREWDFGKVDHITIMPQLKKLLVSGCIKLKSVPDQILRSTALEELRIIDCPISKKRLKKDLGEDWPYIAPIKIGGLC